MRHFGACLLPLLKFDDCFEFVHRRLVRGLQKRLGMRIQLAAERVVGMAAEMLHIVDKLDDALAHPHKIHEWQACVHLLPGPQQPGVAVMSQLTNTLHHARALLLHSLIVSCGGFRTVPVLEAAMIAADTSDRFPQRTVDHSSATKKSEERRGHSANHLLESIDRELTQLSVDRAIRA
eukprot:485015-Prymnesium_polylepis.3